MATDMVVHCLERINKTECHIPAYVFKMMSDCFIYIPVSQIARNDFFCPHS